MLVRDFKQTMGYQYPEEFLELLPDICLDEDCESPTEVTEVLTSLRCSNPRCPSKLKVRLRMMMQKLGVKGIGDSVARDIISYFNLSNPLLVFAYNPDEDGELSSRLNIERSKALYEQIKTRKNFTLGEFVKVAQLPNIQNSALEIFKGYSDLSKAYDDIESGGLEFIRSKLSIKKGDLDEDVSIKALKIYESLMTFKTDLFEAIPFVNIVTSDVRTIKVCCSTEVGKPYTSKADFYASINDKYKDKIHVEFVDGVSKKIDYLVWEGGSNPQQFLADTGRPARVTSKVEKVRNFNKQYESNKELGTLKESDHIIPIMSAMEFISALNNL